VEDQHKGGSASSAASDREWGRADVERSCEGLTRLAAILCGTPVALLGLFESNRQKIRSNYRWAVRELPLDSPFSYSVIEKKDVVVVPDTAADETFASQTLVTAGPRVRFFASAPMFDRTGRVIGCLSVFDQGPKDFQPHQIESLKALARQVTALLDLADAVSQLESQLESGERAREELKEIEERARDLFENADDFIMSILSDGTLLHVNRATTEALSYSRADVAKMSIFDFVHPDSRGEFIKKFREVMSSGTTRKVETVFLSGSGHRRTVDGTLIPKVLGDRTAMIRVIFRDISDRKRIETELGRARDAALESARVKSQFLTNVTHEVRTPMNVIVGMLDLLQKTEISSDQRDYTQTALASAESLLATINNILHVSNLESGSLSIMTADFDLRGTAERIVEVMKVMASEKDLEIDLTLEGEIPTVLRGDVARLRQILTNLLTNAIKFTHKGSIHVRVAWERETENHLFFRFEVEDTGEGIPEEKIPRLFEPFFQVDSSAKRDFSGMGLGLATTRQLVELMDGAIGVESEVDKGSTFWFTVPFEKRVAHAMVVAARKSSLSGMRVIVLDRSETSRKIITQYLEVWGIRVRFETTADNLMERLRGDAALGDPYRVAILDLHSPDRNGVALTKEIKDNPSLAATSIILLTSLGEELNDEQIRAVGVSAYCAKPVEQAELFDCLTAVVAKSLPQAGQPTFQDPQQLPKVGSLKDIDPASVRILLAEDKPLNQKLTLNQLRNLGFTADVVSNGREVVEGMAAQPYDLVLMDCQMPEMDGYEATMEIRKREGRNRRTKIVAMTANAREGDRERCLSSGMDDYLSKPVKQDDLAMVLARWLPEVVNRKTAPH